MFKLLVLSQYTMGQEQHNRLLWTTACASKYLLYSRGMTKNKMAVELGRRGGLATKKKLGKEFYSKIGKKGRKKQTYAKKKIITEVA